MALTGKTLKNAAAEVLVEMPGIELKTTELLDNVDLINVNAALQTEVLTGVTEEKGEKRSLMIALTVESAKRAASMAFNTGNSELLRKTNKPKSFYKNLPDLECAAFCRETHAELVPYLSHLLPYGVTAVKLTNIDASIIDFIDFMNEPKDNYDDRKTATEKIEILLDANDVILEGTDLAVSGIEETQPEFVNKYFQSRSLSDTGAHALSLRGHVQTLGGVPMKGVRIVIVGTNVNKRSTAKGNFQVKHLAEAVYQVILTQSGYEDFETTVAIVANQRTELKAVMKALVAA